MKIDFKVGDRVKITDADNAYYQEEGRIDHVTPSAFRDADWVMVFVALDVGKEVWFPTNLLELIEKE